jgi:GT2 family glycosyltransferase
MTEPQVTIVVVPREQFSKARASLESLYTATSTPFALVYVDGNSPPRLRQYLAEQAAARRFTLLRTERYLTSNEARNLGVRQVRTKYVAFVDNDVIVQPGWLEALLRCAEETGAWVVGPLIRVDRGGVSVVHYTGAQIQIVEGMGRRRLEYTPRISPRPQAEAPTLRREQFDLVKFYCVLVRTDVFERVGPLDEAVRCFFEPADFALSIRAAGGSVFFEPAAVATHTLPPPLPFSDTPYFLLRWSNAWLRPTVRHFARKHGLDPDDSGLRSHWTWRSAHRRRLLPPFLWQLLRTRPMKYPAKVVDRILFDGLLEHTVVRPAERARVDRAAPPSHAAPAPTLTTHVPPMQAG